MFMCSLQKILQQNKIDISKGHYTFNDFRAPDDLTLAFSRVCRCVEAGHTGSLGAQTQTRALPRHALQSNLVIQSWPHRPPAALSLLPRTRTCTHVSPCPGLFSVTGACLACVAGTLQCVPAASVRSDHESSKHRDPGPWFQWGSSPCRLMAHTQFLLPPA